LFFFAKGIGVEPGLMPEPYAQHLYMGILSDNLLPFLPLLLDFSGISPGSTPMLDGFSLSSTHTFLEKS
jgi:hypothetical protein